MKRDCPEKNSGYDDNNDVNNLVIQMIEVDCDDNMVRVNDFEMVEVDDETVCVQMVEIDDIEVNNAQLPKR